VELSQRYLSFDGRPFRLRVGLRPLDSHPWLEVDEHYDEELAEKARLLRERHDEVVAALPDPHVTAASEEVLALVVEDLRANHPGIVSEVDGVLANARTGEVLGGLHPVDAAGRLVQEDLVVLVPPVGRFLGGPVLAAASLCFPSRWRLQDKVGLPMAAIHEPVPGYAESLASPTDGALGRLLTADADRPVWRLNWSLHDDPALFQPTGHGETGRAGHDHVTAANAGESVWLRVERQTLRRLPASGGVLFTIHTHQWPLAELTRIPGACADLASTLRTLPPEFAAYKSLPAITPAVLAWLDARG
jgi:Haem-dependent oxidative N-demethylase, alpha subunit-like